MTNAGGRADGRDRKGFAKELAAVLDLRGQISPRGKEGQVSQAIGKACAEMRWHEVFH